MAQPFEQNVIAIVWDFDKTLVDGYMQAPIFKKYNVNEIEFWNEIGELGDKYEKQGIRINKDTIYLNHFLTCVKQGIFKGLNNQTLRELGKELKFYKGLPELFKVIKNNIESNKEFKKFNITVENYIISTGFAEMIKGSSIYEHVDGIWACEFIEEPILSKLGDAKDYINTSDVKEITQIGYAIDNTSKTRAIFEINKGANLYKNIDVNSTIQASLRRVPFENMIYIADGPSDVPVFSVLKSQGGRTFAVYPHGKQNAFQQVDRLRKDGRIDMYGEADYQEGTSTFMWLVEHTNQIAKSIVEKRQDAIRKSVSKPPQHIND